MADKGTLFAEMGSSSALQQKVLLARDLVEESKACFQFLKHDVMNAIAQTSETFNSLSLPLIKLVGLKAEELRQEGRSFVVGNPSSSGPSCLFNNSFDVQKSFCKEEICQLVAEIKDSQKQQASQLFSILKSVEASMQSQEEEMAIWFDEHKKLVVGLYKHISEVIENAENISVKVKSSILGLQETAGNAIIRSLFTMRHSIEKTFYEAASCMCKPLFSYLKNLMASNEACDNAGRIKVLAEQMESHALERLLDMQEEIENVATCLSTFEQLNEQQKCRLRDLEEQLMFTKYDLDEKCRVICCLNKIILDKEYQQQDLERQINEQLHQLQELEIMLEQVYDYYDATSLTSNALSIHQRDKVYLKDLKCSGKVCDKNYYQQESWNFLEMYVKHRAPSNKLPWQNHCVISELQFEDPHKYEGLSLQECAFDRGCKLYALNKPLQLVIWLEKNVPDHISKMRIQETVNIGSRVQELSCRLEAREEMVLQSRKLLQLLLDSDRRKSMKMANTNKRKRCII